MVRELPVFKGWTVDARLKQFRRVINTSDKTFGIDFLAFKSDEGDALLSEYIKSLDPNSELFNEIAKAIL